MTDQILTKPEAAKYLGLPLKYFARQVYDKKVLSYMLPSPAKQVFLKKDLDEWRMSWPVIAAGSGVTMRDVVGGRDFIDHDYIDYTKSDPTIERPNT